MGMSVGGDSDDEMVSAINTTPLVDVMLVLLIIFLITIPVVTHTVPVTLPVEFVLPLNAKPESINLSVTKDGDVYWSQTLIPDSNALLERLKESSLKAPPGLAPEVNIRGDQGARYEHVGKVVVAAQRAGILKIDFVTMPPER